MTEDMSCDTTEAAMSNKNAAAGTFFSLRIKNQSGNVKYST